MRLFLWLARRFRRAADILDPGPEMRQAHTLRQYELPCGHYGLALETDKDITIASMDRRQAEHLSQNLDVWLYGQRMPTLAPFSSN